MVRKEGNLIMDQVAQHKKGWKRIGTPIGILLCIVLVFVLIVNITLIIGSYVNPDKVPAFLGYKPFIVLSGSMEPGIMPGDLIITKNTNPEDIKVGDVITFRPDKSAAISHRVTEISNEGVLSFYTKGDANINPDKDAVLPESLEGKYILRIPKLGNVALFLQTPIGLLIFVVIPLCLFILFDIVSRNFRRKGDKSREAQLEAELTALKAAAAAREESAKKE
jgi:signal peptidase